MFRIVLLFRFTVIIKPKEGQLEKCLIRISIWAIFFAF